MHLWAASCCNTSCDENHKSFFDTNGLLCLALYVFGLNEDEVKSYKPLNFANYFLSSIPSQSFFNDFTKRDVGLQHAISVCKNW